jgi:hypothetical protein
MTRDNFLQKIRDAVESSTIIQPKMDRLVQDICSARLRPLVVFVDKLDGIDSVVHLLYALQCTGEFEHVGVRATMAMKECLDKRDGNHEKKFLGSVAVYSGGKIETAGFEPHTSSLDRERLLEVFNHPKNVCGAFVRVLILTNAGSTGLTLRNTHTVFFLGPYENIVTGMQYEGRCVRRAGGPADPDRGVPAMLGGFEAKLDPTLRRVIERPVVTMLAYVSNLFGYEAVDGADTRAMTWDEKTFNALEDKVYLGNLQSILFTWCSLNRAEVVSALRIRERGVGRAPTCILEPFI